MQVIKSCSSLLISTSLSLPFYFLICCWHLLHLSKIILASTLGAIYHNVFIISWLPVHWSVSLSAPKADQWASAFYYACNWCVLLHLLLIWLYLQPRLWTVALTIQFDSAWFDHYFHHRPCSSICKLTILTFVWLFWHLCSTYILFSVSHSRYHITISMFHKSYYW